MKDYVLSDGAHGGGFYKGKMYIYQGCQYPCYSDLKKEAKTYKNKKVAENVCKKLASKGFTGFNIIELKEGE